jgi:2-polyprenyl-3-methyl-5-hydroxy-6-metoxy-1,4-benzoquinol methylase
MICRVCGSANVNHLGRVQYYREISHEIYDCGDCRSRFTQHCEVAESMHANPNSGYGIYRDLAQKVKWLFDAKNLNGLRAELGTLSKYKFIINAVTPYPKDARFLEVACSRGYLTSYFILAGRDVIGTDISKSAVAAAKANFGSHFFTNNDPTIAEREPYDVIYHVGAIGCVENPVSLTRSLLNMLKPGGKLLFNAPNARACWLRGQLWIDFAPPPDVVTLYTPGFWTRTFSSDAFVREEVENLSPEESFLVGLRKIMRRWKPPPAGSIETSITQYRQPSDQVQTPFERAWGAAERCALRPAKMIGAVSYAPLQPSPYGIYVTLTKRA